MEPAPCVRRPGARIAHACATHLEQAQKEYRDVLLRDIDPSNLPTFLGGGDDSLDFGVSEIGPWSHLIPDIAAKKDPGRP